MKSSLMKMEYPFKKMKLNEIFYNENYKADSIAVNTSSIHSVYGKALSFAKSPEDRPYIYSSLVTSLDGRIAFTDAPEGPFIASKNRMDPEGGLVDWWTLNVLRASADAILFGAGTLKAEPNATGHVYDQELENERIQLGKNPVPWNVIPTFDGTDIPYDHKEFTCGEVPIIIYTVQKAVEFIKSNLQDNIIVLDANNITIDKLDISKKYILVADSNGNLDNIVGMKALKMLGIDKFLIESPTVLHFFIKDQLVDELFFNYSCVYVGGSSLTIGQLGEEFTSVDHPHSEIISIYMHSPSFMYLRHKLVYNK